MLKCYGAELDQLNKARKELREAWNKIVICDAIIWEIGEELQAIELNKARKELREARNKMEIRDAKVWEIGEELPAIEVISTGTEKEM
ncbi:unnamed protein product [Ilex paraguariensis]|uniref:Uncharacterized protein n=1 Tax=Ilex paraguariensis TaxID=185542 RepID=A0ABC8R0X6_9AQUA